MTPTLAGFLPWRTRIYLALGFSGFVSVIFLLGSGAAYGQPTPGALNAIVEAFSRVQAFEGALQNAAMNLFGALAVMSLTLSIGRWIKGNTDFGDLAGALVDQMVTLGFFYFVLLNAGPIFRGVIDSFAFIANEASVGAGGSRNMSPSDIIGVGINTTKAIWDGLTIISPVQSFLLTCSGVAVIASYAILTALMIEVMIEAQIIASISVVYMAFGGSHWTRDMAVAMFRAAIGVGTKRLFIQIIIGLTEVLMKDMAASVQTGLRLDYVALSVLIAVPIVIVYLAQSLPQRAQHIINGSYVGGYGLQNAVKSGIRAATAAALGMAGAGAATTAAFNAASSQMAAREAAGGATSTGLSRAAQITGGAIKNLSGAMASDVGSRLSGNYGANHGHMGFRAARSLNAAASKADAAAGKKP